MKNQIIFIFYHYYYLTYSRQVPAIEKKMLESFASENNIVIHLENDEIYLYDDVLYSFELKFEFLYYFFKAVVSNYHIDQEIKNILKNYSLMIGFCDSDINELNDYLLNSIIDGRTFEQVLIEVSV